MCCFCIPPIYCCCAPFVTPWRSLMWALCSADLNLLNHLSVCSSKLSLPLSHILSPPSPDQQKLDNQSLDLSDDEELREQMDMHSIINSCINDEPLFTAEQVAFQTVFFSSRQYTYINSFWSVTDIKRLIIRGIKRVLLCFIVFWLSLLLKRLISSSVFNSKTFWHHTTSPCHTLAWVMPNSQFAT